MRKRITRSRQLIAETLESRHLLAADPVLSEFMAANDDSLVDEDGDHSDWIEILNAGNSSAELRGWYLTDDATNLSKWRFPSVELSPNETVIVYASGKDRNETGFELHTNFGLNRDGEYLALVEPDGTTIASEFSPAYAPQVEDVSYGFPTTIVENQLVGDAAAARVLIPTDDTVDPSSNDIQGSWLDPTFDDTAGSWFDAS
ncbi:MAG: lamin tail domain-containing protein, partial [Planctomycetales bacterium]|nr:lamin tail domain-containing protein [Planctomycetales bacterium]